MREIGRGFASLNALGNEGLACLDVGQSQIGDVKRRLQCQDLHLELFEFFGQVKVYGQFELPQNKPRCFV